MIPEQEALIAAIRQAMTGKQVSLPQNLDWVAFYRLAVSHGLEAMVAAVLRENPLVPAEIQKNLHKAYSYAIFRDTQFSWLQEQLTEKLTALRVYHVFQKGGSLRFDYPQSALRIMSDLDVLVHPEDFEAVRQAAEALGGVSGHRDGNHRSYDFPGGIAVEFHPNMIHQGSTVASGINPGWQYVRPGDGYRQELTQEGFYLNVICHLADHFAAGGIGVRFVLDVWVCRHLRMPLPERSFVERELKRFGLLDFARKIEALAESWFGTEPMTPELEELGEYIMTSGSYGVPERAMLNAVCLSPGGTGVSALMQKAFYPRKELETRYPWVKDRPWLLPAAWLARAFRAVTVHGGHVRRWIKGTAGHSRKTVSQQRKKLERFGVKRNDIQ